MKNTFTAIILYLLAFSLPAQAGLLRYDVSFDNRTAPSNVSALGYMIFKDNGGIAGNLFPNIVDWEFEYEGFVFNTSNTQPLAISELIVDAEGKVVSDGNALPFDTLTFPCFSIDGCQDTDSVPIAAPAIYFTQSLGALGVVRPDQRWVVEFGTLTYSDPIAVPLPGTLGLLALGFFALTKSRSSIGSGLEL